MPATTDMSPAAILRAAWALIEDPAHWTTEVFARDLVGNGVGAGSAGAICWCAGAAIVKVCGGTVGELFEAAVRFLSRACSELFQLSIAVVNDFIGHDAVRRVYARAIDMAEARNG